MKIFYVKPTTNGSNHSPDECQAILTKTGTVMVGVDVWRSLNKYDTPSHSYEWFKSMEDMKKKFYIIPKPKSYFMEGEEKND